MAVKYDWQYRFLLALAPLLYKLLVGTILFTCRKEGSGRELFARQVRTGRPFIITFWHYNVLYAAKGGGGLPMVAMVSPSKDGEFIARIMESRGIATVRGSRSKGGVGAIKGLLKAVRQGLSPVLIADGSQGPARVAQGGAVMLAGRSGIPILAMNWAFSRYRLFRSWDKTLLPLPFSRMVWQIAEPLHVPKGLDSEGLEEYRVQLQERLDETYARAWAVFDKKGHAE
ncbi:MAG: hypothetical protein C0613_14605 [Desulfobulbaceae bacterium]|nr:MAG: hypothetical protein C0613_14605 [Desulfobulbaceae bacterium]